MMKEQQQQQGKQEEHGQRRLQRRQLQLRVPQGIVSIFWFFLRSFCYHRPSMYICLITIIAYWDDIALFGEFVYDDAGSVRHNVVVTGQVPWTEAFTRDYWGTIMTQPQSHKSFRPITTLSFKLNYLLSQYSTSNTNTSTKSNTQQEHSEQTIPATTTVSTYSFHVVNVILHGIVSALVTEVAIIVFGTVRNHHEVYVTNQRLLDDGIRQIPSTSSVDTFLISVPAIVTGLVFGLHPIHTEAVSNITSRGELLMSFFTLIGFISYINGLATSSSSSVLSYTGSNGSIAVRTKVILCIYVIPCCCMILSLFSKEQGATTLLSILCYDFIVNHYSVRQYLSNLIHGIPPSSKEEAVIEDRNDRQRPQQQQQQQFLFRAIILLVQTFVLVMYRKWLNGITTPDFIYDQNPAGFASERLTRFLSIPYVYCLYIYDIIIPNLLCPDWSGHSIQLLTSVHDVRTVLVYILLFIIIMLFWSLFMNVQSSAPINATTTTSTTTTTTTNNNESNSLQHPSSTSRYYDYTRQIILVSFFAFILCPFLLSSNLLVVVGLMKADRVMYLPLLGFCLLQGLIIQLILIHYYTDNVTVDWDSKVEHDSVSDTIMVKQRQQNQHHQQHKEATSIQQRKQTSTSRFFSKSSVMYWLSYILFLTQMTYYTMKVHERNIAWSSSERLWISAYKINPYSHHTVYNCGYELSLRKRYMEAEYVLRPIGDPTIDGPSNTFVYAMVLYNLQRCTKGFPLIDKALGIVKEMERTVDSTPRNTKSSIARTKSNLLIAKAFCTMDIVPDNDDAEGVSNSLKRAGGIMYEAVQVDPTNQYAIDQATLMVKRIEMFNKYPQLFYQQQRQSRG